MAPKFLLFGDSITQRAFGEDGSGDDPAGLGWGGLLAGLYQRRADIFCRGLSGYTTAMALEVVDCCNADNVGSNVSLITLWFGANDASLPGLSAQHVPIDDYKRNTICLISSLKTLHPQATIILFTVPPVNERVWIMDGQVNRTKAAARAYGDALKEAANEDGVLLYDVWTALEGDKGADVFGKYLNDGLHLSELGNRRVFEGLTKLISSDLPELAPTEAKMPYDLPVWRDML